MSRNWIRAFNLELGDNSGNTISLGAMRVKFLIRPSMVQSLNPAEVRVFNLSKDTAKTVAGTDSEFKHLRVSAGYEDNVGTIYAGSIINSQTGRASPTETFADFFCRDGDQAYNWGHVQKTFAAGSRQQDHVDEVLRSLESLGIKRGTIKGLSDTPYPRAVTLYGMARDTMRIIAKSNNASWFINRGELHHIPNGDKLNQGSAFVLNENTGLIGMPQETQQGIFATALINPQFDIGKQVKIDQASINRAPWTTNYDAEKEASTRTTGVADGTYTIQSIEWRGDTHGDEWYAVLQMYGSKTGAPAIGSQGQAAYPYTGG